MLFPLMLKVLMNFYVPELVSLYREDDDFRIFVRIFHSLAFLPFEDAEDGMRLLNGTL